MRSPSGPRRAVDAGDRRAARRRRRRGSCSPVVRSCCARRLDAATPTTSAASMPRNVERAPGAPRHAERAACTCSRSCSRARATRDRMVPTGTPQISAASRYGAADELGEHERLAPLRLEPGDEVVRACARRPGRRRPPARPRARLRMPEPALADAAPRGVGRGAAGDREEPGPAARLARGTGAAPGRRGRRCPGRRRRARPGRRAGAGSAGPRAGRCGWRPSSARSSPSRAATRYPVSRSTAAHDSGVRHGSDSGAGNFPVTRRRLPLHALHRRPRLDVGRPRRRDAGAAARRRRPPPPGVRRLPPLGRGR